MNKFWRDYPEVSKELDIIKNIIKKSVSSSEKYFEESFLPLIEDGGKMLRPAFLLLSAKFGQCNQERLYNLAASIEMVHLATLIHDDIIDNSKLRRGSESIQSKYGKEYAVYAGDFLFCQCFNMLSQHDYKTENLRDISKAISKICMGEIKQYHFRYTRKVNLRRYIKIISGKTAALFALSFIAGAKEGNCDEKLVRLLGKIGYDIGMAFQCIDDLLDYVGQENELGKSAQSDLKQGYYTLPIIFALEEDKDKELSNILDKSTFSDEDIKKIVSLVKKCHGIEKSMRVAERYTKRAFENIDNLPKCESQYIIKSVVEKLIHRTF